MVLKILVGVADDMTVWKVVVSSLAVGTEMVDDLSENDEEYSIKLLDWLAKIDHN